MLTRVSHTGFTRGARFFLAVSLVAIAGCAKQTPTVAPLPMTPIEPLTAATLPAGTDLRDYIERERPDAVVSRDPRLLAYVATLSDYLTVALPWSETYALAGFGAFGAGAATDERDALARDAVTGEARGALASDIIRIEGVCDTVTAVRAIGPIHTVGYPAGDDVARQLAERVASLASATPRPAWIPGSVATARVRVVALPADSLHAPAVFARAGAVVMPLAGHLTPCFSFRAAPLVETRSHLIVRRGSGVTAIIGDDGGVTFGRKAAP